MQTRENRLTRSKRYGTETARVRGGQNFWSIWSNWSKDTFCCSLLCALPEGSAGRISILYIDEMASIVLSAAAAFKT